MALSSHHRRFFHLGVGVLGSGIALWWSLRGVKWNEVLTALAQVRWGLIPLLVFTFWAHCRVRAYRWRYLLPPPHQAAPPDLFDGLIIGNLCTFLLPLRAGEFIRPYLVSRRGTYPYPACLASVVVERFFDLSSVLLCFGLVASHFSALPFWVYRGAQGLGILAVSLLVGIVVGAFFRGTVIAIVRRLFGLFGEHWRERFVKIVDELLCAAASLRNLDALAKVLAATVFVWGSTFLSYYLFIAMVPTVTPSVTMSVAMTVIVALAVAAPSAPGFLGVYQAGCVGALDLFGVPTEDAIVIALVSHALQYLMVLGFGLCSLRRQGVGWGELRQRVSGEESPIDVVKELGKGLPGHEGARR